MGSPKHRLPFDDHRLISPRLELHSKPPRGLSFGFETLASPSALIADDRWGRFFCARTQMAANSA